jgi:hypothetical protein
MNEFEKVTNSEGANIIYQGVTNKISLQQHPDFLVKPIRILDVGGGIGKIGQILKRQCEEILGPLSQKEFSSLVDYINIDLDGDALKKSPGRTLNQNNINAYELLNKEKSFDFILSINPAPTVKKYTPKILDQMGVLKGSTNAIREIMLESFNSFKVYAMRIDLISASLLLKEQEGQYILATFLDQEVLNGIMQYSKEFGLGLKIKEIEDIHLNESTIDQFIAIDTDMQKNKKFDKFREIYSCYKIVTFGTNGTSNRKGLIGSLIEETGKYHRLANYCARQERFWS